MERWERMKAAAIQKRQSLEQEAEYRRELKLRQFERRRMQKIDHESMDVEIAIEKKQWERDVEQWERDFMWKEDHERFDDIYVDEDIWVRIRTNLAPAMSQLR